MLDQMLAIYESSTEVFIHSIHSVSILQIIPEFYWMQILLSRLHEELREAYYNVFIDWLVNFISLSTVGLFVHSNTRKHIVRLKGLIYLCSW